jgi:hypothetical protein
LRSRYGVTADVEALKKAFSRDARAQ